VGCANRQVKAAGTSFRYFERILPLRPLCTRAVGNGRMTAVDRLSRACKLSGSRLRLDADIKLSKPPVTCALAKSTRREPGDRQRLRVCVEIRAANFFVLIDVNCPILRSRGSDWPTCTVQAGRESRVIRLVNLCRTLTPPGGALPATGPICPVRLVVSPAWLLAAAPPRRRKCTEISTRNAQCPYQRSSQVSVEA
jgi:hypothetical protein